MGSDSTISVVVADNHEIVREGIASRLATEPNTELVGQVDDGYVVIKMCRQLKPNVLLLNLSISGLFDTE